MGKSNPDLYDLSISLDKFINKSQLSSKNSANKIRRNNKIRKCDFFESIIFFRSKIKILLAVFFILSFLTLSIFTPFDNTSKLYAAPKIKVFLDPGHGGGDPGATWYGFAEKVANLDIALRVKSKLEANGFEVAMSRTSDIKRSLDEIVSIANSSGADIFVSIHNNASLSVYSHGTETYWCANGVSGSSQLANLIQSNTISSAGRANRGVKTANFKVIKYTTMPAALIECAFMSNQTENDLLKTDAFREKLAIGIFNGIKEFAKGINKKEDLSQSQTSTTTSQNTLPSQSLPIDTSLISTKNTYSDLSKANSSGFTIKIDLPENGTKVFSEFEIRGWAADLRGTPPKKLAKIEVYKASEQSPENLIGKIENFDSNVLGSQGILDGGFSLNIDIEKLPAGENILYIVAYDNEGKYSVGNLGLIAIKEGDTSLINRNPIALPGGPYSGEVLKEIKFDASASYDPDGVISEYNWDFGDGSDLFIGSGISGAKPTHVYSQKGTYTVTLTVKDKLGLSSAQVVTTVAVIDPNEASSTTESSNDSSSTESNVSTETLSNTESNINQAKTSDTGITENVSNSTSFVGYIEIPTEALIKIFKDRNSTRIDRAARLAPLYVKYAKLFNLRADIAWAQMCHETNFLEFTGDVKPNQNNFCGLGATGGGVPGNSFATEELGVIAHFAHLAWYYYPNHINEYCNKTFDPRHSQNGHPNYTGNTTLGFLNGRWAPGSTYTDKIILFTNQIMQSANAVKNQSVQNNYKIVANAGADKLANVGETLTFDASASIIVVNQNDKIFYNWDFDGDGKIDKTVENAVIKQKFENAGKFEVLLKITSSSGLESKDTVLVEINSLATADAGGPYFGTVGQEIKFDGSKSFDLDGNIIKYLWDFGDGKTAEGISPTHAYEKPGEYIVKLTVVDDKGASSTTAQVKAVITESQTSGTETNTNTGTSDTSSTSFSGAQDTNTSTATTVTETTAAASEANASGNGNSSSSSDTTATNTNTAITTTTETNNGTNTTTTTGTSNTTTTTTTTTVVENKPPVANPGGPYTAKVNQSITFDGSQSTDPDGIVKDYLWDFGNGQTATGQKPSYAYPKEGTYTIKLIVKDELGLASTEATTTATITAEATQQQYPTNTSIITNQTSFVGYTEVTVDQLISIFIKRGSNKVEWAKRLAPLYIKYGKIFNLRADIAWAQMCHETGFLEYTGDVKPNQNNFCGLGATGGGVPGNSFATEELGVIAHFAHLAWYYYPNHINQYCNSTYDPRHFGSTHSKYTGDTTVGFLNGRWAPGATYTNKILQFANQIYGN